MLLALQSLQAMHWRASVDYFSQEAFITVFSVKSFFIFHHTLKDMGLCGREDKGESQGSLTLLVSLHEEWSRNNPPPLKKKKKGVEKKEFSGWVYFCFIFPSRKFPLSNVSRGSRNGTVDVGQVSIQKSFQSGPSCHCICGSGPWEKNHNPWCLTQAVWLSPLAASAHLL